MVEGKVTQAYSKRGFSHKRKDIGRGRESPRDKEKKILDSGEGYKVAPVSLPKWEAC